MSNSSGFVAGPAGFGMKNGFSSPFDGGRIKQAGMGYGRQDYGQ
jgi:hypothetical protein